MNDNVIDFQMSLLKRQHRKQLGMNEFEYNVLMGTMKWLLRCMPPSAKLHARELSIQSDIRDIYGTEKEAFCHAIDQMCKHFHLPEHSINRTNLIDDLQTVGDVAKFMEICILKA